VRGIDVHVHATLALLLVWVAASSWAREGTLESVAHGLTLAIAVCVVIVLHELGHALVAARFGIPTRDITLYPMGGVARLARVPERPSEEIAIAAAGPAVNFALAAAIFAVLAAAGRSVLMPLEQVAHGAPLPIELFWINVSIGIFNLLPAFPMDGGRVLRALLATAMDYVDATRAAATIGRGIAVALGLLGWYASPMLVLVAVFVWAAAGAEATMVEARAVMRGLPVRAAMTKDLQTLDADEPLSAAVRALLDTSATAFPVLEAGRLVGVLTTPGLIAGLAEQGTTAPIRTAMHDRFETADPDEVLDGALARLESSECPAIPVLRGGELVGLVTPENLGELLLLERVMRKARPASRTAVPRAA
jgi:Zn-dependent protease/CBS domain-containing protein